MFDNSLIFSSPGGEMTFKVGREKRLAADAVLGLNITRQPYWLILTSIILYFVALYFLLTTDFSSEPVNLESPMEMVYEEPATPEQQQPEPPPPEVAQPPEPDAVAEPEPEPVKEKIPPVEKPQPEKPKPPHVEKRPTEKPKPPHVGARTQVAPNPLQQSPHTAGAISSNYANVVYQRINRIASGSFPHTPLAPKTVRIGYVIVIGVSGELISKSVSPSGVPALDKAVLNALSMSAPFPAPPNLAGRSCRISGAIVYRVQ